MAKIVAIVGRPNVGKSTLFNRFTESRNAIVHETSGVTRDRHYGKSIWNGIEFTVIDTGGYVDNSEDVFEEEINRQVRFSIEEADIIIFLVDVHSGLTDLDLSMATILRKSGKKVILAVNKVDTNDNRPYVHDFHSLGLGELFPISSSNGSGTGDLLDKVVESFSVEEEVEEPDIPRFAIVGRPNVGKSSLINSLFGEERNIVTPLPGTTRDSINTRFTKYNHDFFLIDTAGLRKKGKVTDDLEFYSVLRSVRAIENSDVCLLLIDATRGVEGQDINIFRLAERNHKGVVILVNKWDLIEKDNHSTKLFETAIRKKIEPFDDVPIIFTSAITKQRLHKVLDVAMEVYKNRMQKISTSVLNKVMLEAIEAVHPPAVKGKFIKIKFVTQLPTHAPTFAFFCNLPQYIKDPYRRYLENQIRKNFNFTGVPILIFFRKK
ncbi:MAG: ribosome biogenesis GTPase Der [Bacteroidales bacterium]|nr:ribosome biogenesis GTPase Der [Bacteroidales bacterium]MCF8389962.1 ribosome biogenesis GTPase Der [Bacteroidales bacterium]